MTIMPHPRSLVNGGPVTVDWTTHTCPKGTQVTVVESPDVETSETSETSVSPEPTVALTQSELRALLAEAVAAGAANAPAPSGSVGAIVVPVAQHDDWSVADLLRALCSRTKWHTEREERSAYAAIDAHFAPVEE